MEDKPHSGRPATCVNTVMVLKGKELVPANYQITISEVAN
jgi:hypothetical protein